VNLIGRSVNLIGLSVNMIGRSLNMIGRSVKRSQITNLLSAQSDWSLLHYSDIDTYTYTLTLDVLFKSKLILSRAVLWLHFTNFNDKVTHNCNHT